MPLEIVDCPLLTAHAPAQNLAIEINGDLPAGSLVDVVFHFHGWAKPATFSLQRKFEYSGVASTPARTRPTVAIVPCGKPGNGDARHFPALDRPSEVDAVIDFVLEYFGGLQTGRRIFTAHSGGGSAIASLITDVSFAADEIHLHDAIYWAPNALAEWVKDNVIARNRALLDSPDGLREGGGFRAICTKDGGTKANTDKLASLLTQAIADDSDDVKSLLGQYVRCELARGVGHSDIARTFGWQLLGDVAVDLEPAPTALV